MTHKYNAREKRGRRLAKLNRKKEKIKQAISQPKKNKT